MPSRDLEVACPDCGELSPANFPTCWSCHADLSGELERRERTDVSRGALAPRLTVHASEDRRGVLFELVAVLLLMVVPSVFWGIHWLVVGGDVRVWTLWDAAYDGLYQLGSLALVLVLLRPDGLVRTLGAERTPFLPELLWALGLTATAFVANIAAHMIGDRLLLPVWEGMDNGPERGGVFFWLGSPFVYLLVGLHEEVLFRAYLWTRLVQLTGRPSLSVVASAAIFSAVHMYDGPGSLSVFFFGLLFGLSFALQRRLWRLVLAHALYNLWITWAPWWLFGE